MQNPNQRNDSYLGNINVKRDGVQHNFTQEEIEEYVRCSQDPVYFCKTYLKVISLDEGLVPFDLYPYQEKMFEHFNTNRFSVVLACRQSGKSISSVGYILWYACFHSEKTIAILANKGATAREMLSRVTLMLENLPFFLQPGCKALNKGSIEFSNNSRIIASATSGSSIRGMSVNLLFLDEFAFVERANEFYTSTYPVISAGKDTKVIVTSTANGIGNTFHKIWEGAVQGLNEYKPFTVNWHDVPGRDAEWKRQTIANTSQLQFDQEYGNTFFGTGDTLVNAETLLSFRAKDPEKVDGDLKIYTKPHPKHEYIMTVDVSKGRGQDYSTATVIDISTRPCYGNRFFCKNCNCYNSGYRNCGRRSLYTIRSCGRSNGDRHWNWSTRNRIKLMALNKATLATEIENAFKASQADTTPAAQSTLANGIAQAINNYLIQATVSTTVTGLASGGVNASVLAPPAPPVPGPITAPATVTGTGTGTLS